MMHGNNISEPHYSDPHNYGTEPFAAERQQEARNLAQQSTSDLLKCCTQLQLVQFLKTITRGFFPRRRTP